MLSASLNKTFPSFLIAMIVVVVMVVIVIIVEDVVVDRK